MKGFSTKGFDIVISRGLRRYPENSRDEPELVELHNLCPTEEGVDLHSLIYSINSGSWDGDVPWIYLQDANYVLIEDSTGEPTEVVM